MRWLSASFVRSTTVGKHSHIALIYMPESENLIAPLNAARDQVLKDAAGETIVWAIEMDGAGQEARDGVSVNGFPRGTIVSVGLHPLRNGFPGGGRGESGLFKCPADTPPAPGAHCDSVAGNTSHGDGVLPMPTGELPLPVSE